MRIQMNRIRVPLLITPPPTWENKPGHTHAVIVARTAGLGLRARRSGAFEKGADGGLVGVAVVAVDVRAGHPDRVAEEVVLVQRLAAGEGRDAGVPDQP